MVSSGRLCCGLVIVLLLGGAVSAQSDRTIMRPGDVVGVAVVGQPALNRQYQIEADGTLTLSIVGQVKAAGLTAEQLAAELSRRLAEFLVSPQVEVHYEAAARVFVFGAVKAPGPLALTHDMTVLEALSRAGYSGTSEVIVVRPKSGEGPARID